MTATSLLIDQLRQLKLAGMLQALAEYNERPAQHTLSFNEQLALLLDRELLHRTNRKVARLLRQAKLRQQACFQAIDFNYPRELNKEQVLTLMSCEFIHHHHNLLITGPTGCGKSYLACAIGHQACQQRLSVRYVALPRFLEEMRIAQADGSYSRYLDQLLSVELLIFDDFGLAPGLNPSQRRDFFNVIEERHQRQSTLITSQLPIKHWHEFIGESTLADAVLDRLLQNAHRIELKGESMRKNNMALDLS